MNAGDMVTSTEDANLDEVTAALRVPGTGGDNGTSSSFSIAADASRLALSARVLDLLRLGGIDRASLYGMAQQVWSMCTAPLVLLMIALRFTPVVQGYYYTFSSLLALQIFAELGLGQVIIQFASHEWAKLEMDADDRPIGDPDALSRLISLGRFASLWYFAAAAITFLLLVPAGLMFFGRASQVGAEVVGWRGPWLALCFLSSVSMCFIPAWSILVGCNQVLEVYRFRLFEDVLGDLTLWTAILLGANLWVPVFCSLIKVGYNGWVLTRKYGAFFRSFLVVPDGPRIAWREELLSLQWRFGLSWLAGYFSFAIFTPIAFRQLGAATAGRMGMTWALLSALVAISSMPVYTKIPTLGALVARRCFEELDRLALRSGITAVIITMVGGFAIWVGIWLLGIVHSGIIAGTLPHAGVYMILDRLSQRLLPRVPAAVFLMATVLMVITLPFSTYLRAHKKEPLVGLSIIQGVLNAIVVWFMAHAFGAVGMAFGYFAVMATVAVPGVIFIWSRCREEWHSPGLAPTAS